jgi:hypothetical protein
VSKLGLVSISLEILLYSGFCGLGAVIADPEYTNFRFGQHLGMGAVLVLLTYFGFGWLLQPMLSGLPDAWFVHIVLTAVLVFLAAIPAGMIVYSLNFRQGRILATTVAVGHVLIALFIRWALNP